ncbi:hypothetical protein PHLCEN_2v6484 [Hermanssonia centrifuga]|uniref:DNA excision repair protein ERCC-1 n=1 Tax=Hermanssonia centrifuga TaxID=98765 RepID=A0A2R6NZ84_9APHY|nr:hypothetical protein PHLCEN_2v6484 [Hermanssonia centrifuga]
MEEAGFYLSTLKQFEHKPPDLIKERVDKDYHSMLRTVLTSVGKVNKTDVEILRTSFGSFANIARSTSEQLLQLPGFGQVKARRIRDAFEKPFRNNATSALSFQQPISAQGKGQSTNGATSTRREAEMESLACIHESPPSRTTRDPSPMWDIELDLNSSPPLEEPAARQFTPGPSNPKKRPPSPVWDIELDLNEESEDHTIHKRHRGDAEEFDPTSLLQ